VRDQPRHYALTYGTRLATAALGFVVGVISARGLGPDGRGELAIAGTAAGVIVQIANFGLSSAIIYFVSRRSRRAGTALAMGWLAGGVLFAAGMAALGATGHAIAASSLATAIACWAPVQLIGLLQDQIWIASRRLGRFNALQVTGRVLAVGAAIVSIARYPGDALAFIWAQVAAETAAVTLSAVALLGARVAPRLAGVRAMRPVAALAMRAMPVLVLPFLLLRSDILLLGWLRTAAETGLYAVAVQFADLLSLLPATASAVLFPAMAIVRQRDARIAAVARSVLILLVGLASAIVVTGPWIIPAVFGAEFSPAYALVACLLPGVVMLGYQTVIAVYYTTAGYPRLIGLYWAIGLTINVILNLVTIPAFGAVAAALSSTLSYGLVAWLVVRRFGRDTGRGLFDVLSAARGERPA